jgi:nitrate reductase gamma subunit
MAVLLALLIRRMMHPVLKMISNADDYISWFVSFFPLLTGTLAFAHIDIGIRYETMLAIHILSVELLMIWFPFGKLIHGLTIWPSRYQLGVTFGRRGVKA